MNKRAKRKGYTLAIILVICAFMTMTTLATFSVVLRYSHIAKQQTAELQSEIASEPVAEESE